MRIPTLFRIWYSTTYTVLFFVLIILLAISPADTIYQSIKTREIQKLFVIGGVYLLTGLIVLLVYSTRLYTNRTVLQAIPKPYVPVEDGEVGSLVRRMIVKALRKSAVVAWDSRPRDVRGEARALEGEDANGRPTTAERAHHKRKHTHPATILPISPNAPPWGHISHPGWASPASPDLPNLQYTHVVSELPNLIEAKAVSLAPPDPAVEDLHLHHPSNTTPPLPNAQIVALLQRPRTMGLRDYLARLSSFGLLNPPSLAPRFLALYEHARFSTSPLTEPEFRATMAVFADILNGMTYLDPLAIEEARASSAFDDDAIDALETRSLAPSISSSSRDSSRTGLPYTTPLLDKQSAEFSFGGASAATPQTLRTAPSRQRNRSEGVYTLARTPSEQSVAESGGGGSVRRRRTTAVQRSPSTILPNSSESSLGSGASVVRLRMSPGEGEAPYEYQFGDG